MPQEIFDSAFAQRVVRMLSLKRGRGVVAVDDTIQPVIDLSSLVSNPPTDIPASALEAFIVSQTLTGLWFNALCLFNPVIGAGNVMVGQILNPAGSGRFILLEDILSWSAINFLGRRSNTALADLLPIGNPLVQLRQPGQAPVAEIRRQVIAVGGVPPAGSGPVSHYNPSQALGTNLLFGRRVILEPGQGYIFYPCSNAPAADTVPAPTVNQVMITTIGVMEFAGVTLA